MTHEEAYRELMRNPQVGDAFEFHVTGELWFERKLEKVGEGIVAFEAFYPSKDIFRARHAINDVRNIRLSERTVAA